MNSESKVKRIVGEHGFLPILLVVVSLLLMTGFESVSLMNTRRDLKSSYDRQTPVIEQSQRMRAQLDSIAKRTVQLAKGGNQSARSLVDQLKKAGVTINTENAHTNQ